MMSSWSKYGKRQKNQFLRELEQVERDVREENLQRAERERQEYDDWVGDDLWDDIDSWNVDDYGPDDEEWRDWRDRDDGYWDDWEKDCESMFRAGDHVRSNGSTYLVLEDGRYADLSTGAVGFAVYDAELIWRR